MLRLVLGRESRPGITGMITAAGPGRALPLAALRRNRPGRARELQDAPGPGPRAVTGPPAREVTRVRFPALALGPCRQAVARAPVSAAAGAAAPHDGNLDPGGPLAVC
jgi:hypothetical protein